MSAVAYKIAPRVEGYYAPNKSTLTLLPPVPDEKPLPRSIYRKRRIVAAVIASALVLFFSSILNQGLSWTWGRLSGESTSAATPIENKVVQTQSWVVRPGDTLWGIAKSVQPEGDIRPLVQKLSTQYKNRPLLAGEIIAIPALE